MKIIIPGGGPDLIVSGANVRMTARPDGSNVFGDQPVILGDARMLNVAFPADWTDAKVAEWRRLHGLTKVFEL